MAKKYTYQEHKLSEPEKVWLQEVAAAKGNFNVKAAKVRLKERLPKNFDPTRIDKRLYSNGNLEIIGLRLIDPHNPLFDAMDKTIRAIRDKIIEEKSGREKFTAIEISIITGLDEQIVGRVLKRLSGLGNFWGQGGGTSPEMITDFWLSGDNGYDEYLYYENLDDVLEKYYLQYAPGGPGGKENDGRSLGVKNERAKQNRGKAIYSHPDPSHHDHIKGTVTLDEEEIRRLPRWAQVALAARCARRVQPLFTAFWPDASKEHVEAVETAISAAETAASTAERAHVIISSVVARAAAAARNQAHGYGGEAYTAAYVAHDAISEDYPDAAIRAATRSMSFDKQINSGIRKDIRTISEVAKQNKWTDETPVGPDVFGPMWAEGEPDWVRITSQQKDDLKTGKSKDNLQMLPEEAELEENVFRFLMEKGWKQSQIERHQGIKNDILCDMTLKDDNHQLLAIIELKLFKDQEMVFAAALQTQQYVRQIDERALGYIICPAKKHEDGFEIFEFNKSGNPLLIKNQDFPTPFIMRFLYGLGDNGRSIVRALIACADDISLKVNAKSDSWINLQVNGCTAAQIHWYKHPDFAIGLALAGYIEAYFDSPYHFPVGRIEELSGYKSGIRAEINWLNGKLGHERLKYRSTVCVIEREFSGVPEHIDEIRALLQVAKGNIEMGSERGAVKTSARESGIPTMASDRPGAEDLLGRKRLAESLAKMFVHTKDIEGFTVALLGEWGEGKSTVMGLVEKELEKQPFEFAKFNAWEYEHTDNIAAGLAQEVLKGLLRCKGKAAYLRQLWVRVSFACKTHPWGIVGLCGCILIAVCASLLLFWNRDLFWLGVTSLSFVPLLLKTYDAYKRAQSNSLALQMLEYLRLPEYQKHLGLIPILKKDIQTLCNLRLGKTRKLLVLVDDLDRCQPGCIAKTLDAIRLVMSIPNVIVMIGIDHRIAFKAVEKTYKTLEDGNRSKADIARDYLGKIILLPVRLSTTGPIELQEYVNKKLFSDAEEIVHEEKTGSIITEPAIMPTFDGGDEILIATPEITNTEPSDFLKQSFSLHSEQENTGEEIEKAMHETTEERDEFYDLAIQFKFSNPRQLLRLRNSYRLLKALNEKGKYDCERLLPMIFWQEFLHNFGIEVRGWCMAAIKDEAMIEKITVAEARNTVKTIRRRIVELFKHESYEEIAGFVRCVVLPHSEEGVLDTVEEIDELLKRMSEEQAATIRIVKDQPVKMGN